MPVAPTAEPEAAPISNEHDVTVPTDPSRKQNAREDDVISITDSATEASRCTGASTGDHRPLENGIDEEDQKPVIFSSPCQRLSKEHPAGTVPGIEGELDGHSCREQSDIGVPGGAEGAGTVASHLDLPDDVPVEEVPVPAKISPVGGGKTVVTAVDGSIKGNVDGVSAYNAAEPVHVPNSRFQSLPPSSEISFDAESFQADSGVQEDKKSGSFSIGMEGGSEFGIGSGDTRGVSSDEGVLSPPSTQPSRSPHRPSLTDASSLRDVAALVDAEGMAAEQEFLEALQAVGRGGAADGAAGEIGFGEHVEAGDREEKMDVYGTGGGAMGSVDNAETATRAMGSGDTFSVHDGGGEFFVFGGDH